MDRTYLFVAPEENAEVRSEGARWDDFSKRWYIGPEQAPERFSRWLPAAEEDDGEFTITSSDACVAAATISCRRCHADTEVICKGDFRSSTCFAPRVRERLYGAVAV